MKQLHTLFILTVALLLAACKGGKQGSNADGGDTIRFKYATLISAVRYADHIDVRIADPWHEGRTLRRYVLAANAGAKKTGDATLVCVPLQRAVVSTTVHSSLLMQLGAIESIGGVCDLQYVGIPEVQRLCKEGRIKDCGNSMQPDAERILDLEADAILMSPFENSGGYGKLEKIGVPLIECADYMEPSPLGRAEWMRFYGMLAGKEREADSLFAIVRGRYEELKAKAAATKERPTVVMDKLTSGVWYVPGGASTIGQMLADAGASYVYANEKKAGSLSLPFESVFDKAGEADYWLLRYAAPQPLTYAQLAAEHKGYAKMRAYIYNNVYGCNTLSSHFFEESPFRPDYLLEDFVGIFHSDATNDKPLRYFEPLKK